MNSNIATTEVASTSGTSGSSETSGMQGQGGVLDEVHDWFSQYVCTLDDLDLDLLVLWTMHTHLIEEMYTTPRLLLDSPVPGSGKTTVLDHISRLGFDPVQAASLGSPALLARILNDRPRTILIDEADRSLDPRVEKTGELIGILNSGYRRGGSRPVLEPGPDGAGWVPKEMPTFGAVAMAGNSPNLPDDTQSRTIRVLLMPDLHGEVEDSDWEVIETPAAELHDRIAAWAESVREEVRVRPPLPDEIRGRAKERWSPLKRIAVAAGGRWPGVVDELALREHHQLLQDREDGVVTEKPAVRLLRDLHSVWPAGEAFAPSGTLIELLSRTSPDAWGLDSPLGSPLTATRMGKMLVKGFNINSVRQSTGDRARGYSRAAFARAWRQLGIEVEPPTPLPVPDVSDIPDMSDVGPVCPKHSVPLEASARGLACSSCVAEIGGVR